MTGSFARPILFTLLVALTASVPAHATDAHDGGGHGNAAATVPPPAPPGPKELSAREFVTKEPARAGYCANIADAAADARFAWQRDQLGALEKQVEDRIRQLEEKRAEYETWVARRDAFLAKADEAVVGVYAKMRPDAAALQIANMPEDAGAAILAKLNARGASAILAEMEATRAASLARQMTDAGRRATNAPKATGAPQTGRESKDTPRS